MMMIMASFLALEKEEEEERKWEMCVCF